MLTPQRFGKYVVKESLGEGSMAHVYRAYDSDLDRDVAIKSLKGQLLLDEDNADELLHRFAREARIVAQLRHDSFATIYEYAEKPPYIAMELLEGKTLAQLLRENHRFTVQEATDIVQQLLSALGFAHTRQVIHRDVKPQNIFLQPDGRIKITDFGIAQIQTSTLTQMGSVMGTAAYMSPEQFAGERVDARSDLWSVGIILFELLSGKRPFRGGPDTVRHKVMTENPAFEVSEPVRRIPEEFEPVIRQALHKSPEKRFQDAAQFAAALEDAHAKHLEARRPGVSSEEEQDVTTRIHRPAKTPDRRLRPPLLSLVLGVPVAFSILVYVVANARVDVSKIAYRVDEVKCSALDYDVEGKDITLSGVSARQEDIYALRADLARLVGQGKVRGEVTETDPRHCDVLDYVRALKREHPQIEPRLKLSTTAPLGYAKQGSALSLSVSGAAHDGYLLLDYFMGNGEVLHLAPDRQQGEIKLAAGQTFTLSANTGEPIEYEVACPCGRELLLAVSSSAPLALAGREESEPAHPYLEALAKAVKATAQGVKISVQLLPLTTVPQ